MKPQLILMVLAVLLVLLYVYNTSSEGFESNYKSVIILKAEWCGHCKEAAPEFKKLVDASPITLEDGTKVDVKILDADNDKEEVGKYNIKGFPTILIVEGSTTTEYPGKRTHAGVMDFLNSAK